MEWSTLREKVGQCGNREPYQEAIAESRGKIMVI